MLGFPANVFVAVRPLGTHQSGCCQHAAVAGGAAAGLAFSLAAIRPLAALAPAGVNAWDPIPFTALLLLLFLTGGVAAFLPARRAIARDPAEALRRE